MGFLGGGPSISPAAQLPAPAPAPTRVDPTVTDARRQNRMQAALAAGRASTILTGSQGLAEASNEKKRVLGA